MHTKTQRIVFLFIILAALLLLTTGLTQGKDNPFNLLATQLSVTTGFTYQGQLTEAGTPADGVFDLQFELYDAVSGGALLATVAVEDVVVADGIFTVLLDFGAGDFDGQARWLTIGVRTGTETGAYTPLTPRQALTAAPYAQYALEAWSVAWGNIGDNPIPDNCTTDQIIVWNETLTAWECATDTDTTYSAGFGLELVDAPLNRPLAPAGNTTTAVDIAGYVGMYTSITIGADGLPVISYYDATNENLKVAHCNDFACTSATTAAVDTNGSPGLYTSITIGVDGLPVISYYDHAYERLKVAHCNDIACTSATTTAVFRATIKDTSITIGADGLPVISYYDDTNKYLNGDLMVAHCNDVVCTGATTTTVDNIGDVGLYTSIALGANGLPVISYYDNTNFDLKVAHCNDTACTSVTISVVDTVGSVGYDTSITIGADGLPVISYNDATNYDLKVAHCNDIACTSATTTAVDTVDRVGRYTSITIGADGLPVISYSYHDNDWTNFDLKLAHCNDAACTSATTTSPDTVDDVGLYTSITIGADSLPVISYHDTTNLDLKVTHCSTPSCVPFRVYLPFVNR